MIRFFSKNLEDFRKKSTFVDLIINTTTVKAEESLYALALSMVPNIGCVRAKQIIANLGSAEAFFKEKPKNLRKLVGLSNHKLTQASLNDVVKDANKIFQTALQDNQTIYHYLDDEYPRRLKQIDDAPIILFGKGNIEANAKRTLGIVGTRNATHYGKQVTEDIVMSIKNKDIVVISGLAMGIDGVAHRICVDQGTPTIGLLGHGLDLIYPYQHKKLAEEMMINGGLLTEFPNGTKPDACNFPMRNRIVAGMVDALIVVESDIQGGSLITCNLANDYGKDVFAVPGPIYSKYSRGCHKIISNNKAHVFSGIDDFFETMEWQNCTQKPGKQMDFLQELDEQQKAVFGFIKEKKQASVDVLSVVHQIPLGQLSGVLLTMEIAGFLKTLPGKMYALSDRFAY
jgi:DNA processing protein